MFIKNFILNITTETGSNVGNFIISGAQIPAESTSLSMVMALLSLKR